MATIKLLSFQTEKEIAAKAKLLRRRGVIVDATPLIKTSAAVGELAQLNPAVLVFDLDKLPSTSRVIAAQLRDSKSARHIPLLFVGGDPAKLDRVRAEQPGATFTAWEQASEALARLLESAPQARVVTVSRKLPSSAETPLPRKLGVIAATSAPRQIALLAAPDGFIETLGDLPASITFSQRITAKTALALCFVRTPAELAATVDLLAARLPQGASAWIVHPKRHHKPVFHQDHVRDAALAVGLVDYKVCSVDNDWSALKFAHRKR